MSFLKTLNGIFTGKIQIKSSLPFVHKLTHTMPAVPFYPTTMPDTINEQTVTKSLKLLRDGFKSEFATFVLLNERTCELLMELSSEFIDENIPVVDENNRIELAMMLMETLDVVAR